MLALQAFVVVTDERLPVCSPAARSAVMEELVDVVDGSDVVLGVKARADIDSSLDRYRIVAVWVTNADASKVLLGRRADTKESDPGLWAPPVAGAVQSGESYVDAIVRETSEEIGVVLDPASVVEEFRLPLDEPGALRFVCVARLVVDEGTVFELDRTEYSELRWFTVQELDCALLVNPARFVSSAAMMFALLR